MATLDDLVRQAVEAYLSHSQMSERKLGAFAVGDPAMVPRLMTGGSIRLDKADQLLCYMNQAPIGPGFVSEVEAFLSDTGIGHRRFGSIAAGDPLFMRKLQTGASAPAFHRRAGAGVDACQQERVRARAWRAGAR